MTAPTQPEQVAKAWARWIRDAPISARTEDAFRAGPEYALAVLPRREPSDAEVERAAASAFPEVFELPRINLHRSAYEEATRRARAALSALPALPTPDAAALRAEGFEECQRDAKAILAYTQRAEVALGRYNGRYGRAKDVHERCAALLGEQIDAIAALKPGNGT